LGGSVRRRRWLPQGPGPQHSTVARGGITLEINERLALIASALAMD
jgi:hypothetical protein